jgi:hypothetical protein
VTLQDVTAPYSGITIKVTANGAPATSQTASVTISPGESNAPLAYTASTNLKITNNTVTYGTVTIPRTWDLTVSWNPVTPPTGEPNPTSYTVELDNNNQTIKTNPDSKCSTATCTSSFAVSNFLNSHTYIVKVTANGASATSATAQITVISPRETVSPQETTSSSSVFSEAVAQTATAMSNTWNAITNPIVQLLTSL